MDFSEHMSMDYHDRLEYEVTNLKRDYLLEHTRNTLLDNEIKKLRMENEQLRQAIAVLNDLPTNPS